jgi:hypothetical protein
MKLMIIGHARHGKDTVAEQLQKRYRMKFVSSSVWCAENIMMSAFLKKAKATPDKSRSSGCAEFPYGSVKECFEDRVNHREFWHKTIAEYCEADLPRVGLQILDANDIYVGCRNFREFEALKACAAFDFSIWVDASKRLPPEDERSMGLFPWQADYILDNNGTIEQMAKGLNRLMTTLRTKGRR